MGLVRRFLQAINKSRKPCDVCPERSRREPCRRVPPHCVPRSTPAFAPAPVSHRTNPTWSPPPGALSVSPPAGWASEGLRLTTSDSHRGYPHHSGASRALEHRTSCGFRVWRMGGRHRCRCFESHPTHAAADWRTRGALPLRAHRGDDHVEFVRGEWGFCHITSSNAVRRHIHTRPRPWPGLYSHAPPGLPSILA